MSDFMKSMEPRTADAAALWDDTLKPLADHVGKCIATAPGDEAVKAILAYRSFSSLTGFLAAAMEEHARVHGAEPGWQEEVKPYLHALIERAFDAPTSGRKLSS